MPIYEYRCESCGEELEKIQKFSDSPLTDCPACGKASLKKLVSASSFRLKGSGWYETDFKDKKDSKTNKGASAGSSKSSSDSNSSNSKDQDSASKSATEGKADSTKSSPGSSAKTSTD